MNPIVVCGEALMDVFALADTVTGMSLEARIGGSPLNVAIGLARQGQPASFFGALSNDSLGERLTRALHDEGVDTSMVVRVDAPTTLGVVGLDASGVASYSFYGDGGADRQLNVNALHRLPADAAAIHVGSFAMVVEPISSTLRTLISGSHKQTLISYDPNVRLNVDPDLTRWRAVFDWMLTRSHIVKVSDDDLSLLCPGVSTADFFARALAHGVGLVVVTHGASGVAGATQSGQAAVPATVVEVVDTVGAGDTFQAALLTWLAENSFLRIDGLADVNPTRMIDALRFASTAASLTCSRRGADLPRREELKRAIRRDRGADTAASYVTVKFGDTLPKIAKDA